MNDTNPISTQWLHYYQQHPTTTTITTSNPVAFPVFATETSTSNLTTNYSTSTISSPNNLNSMPSGTNNYINKVPQGGGTAAKPIRRRSRASRRTPTTLLNASTTNFRTLVQQFTGCQNNRNTSNSNCFGTTQRGPFNLSFGNQNDHQQLIGTSSTSIIAPFGSGFFNNQQLVQQQDHQQWQQLQLQRPQERQENYAKQANNMQSANFGDFVLDDVSDLGELMDESSSFSGNRKDAYYFKDF